MSGLRHFTVEAASTVRPNAWRTGWRNTGHAPVVIGRRAIGFVLAFAAIVGFVAFVVTREGYRTTATELHDGTVWTISRERDAVARVNARIKEFDTRIRNEMESADLYQDGKSVYLRLPEGIVPLNAVGTSIETGLDPAEFAIGTQFGVAGGIGAVLDPDGRVWATASSALAGIDPESTEPDAEVHPGSMLSVTPDGYVVVIDPVDDVVLVGKSEAGDAEVGEPVYELRDPEPFGHDLPTADQVADADAGALQFTAVGDTAVVLWNGELLIEGQQPVTVPDAATATLQQPGIASTDVLLADAEGLWLASLEGGPATLRVGGGEGVPAAPVVVGGCAYAGWEALGRVWRNCDGQDEVLDARVDDASGTNWVFRVNRSDVVLEADGIDPIQITDDGLVTIDNWDDFEGDEQEPDDSQTEEVLDQNEKAECQDGAAPPEAADDSFGATPGVAVVLQVLDNDRDPNCDPMAIQDLVILDPLTEGTIALIDQRQAIQYTPPPLASANVSFGYTIDDGRGGQATANVQVQVGATTNRPPQLKEGRQSTTIVELFRTVSYNVLFDWVDPDGDTLILQSALLTEPASGAITWSKDGTITYTATDTVAGPKEVAIQVSDGFGNVSVGALEVAVQGEGVPLPPTARDDYLEAPAGREVLVSPLGNDTDPNGDPLVLGRYDAAEGLSVVQSDGGVLRLLADTPGTYLVPYEATDGSLSDDATIRFEVTPLDRPQRPPVAVRDSIVLEEGASLNVDVLANDYDADGDVLILTDAVAQLQVIGGIQADAIERRFVRVQIDQDPGQPVVIDYSISDGINPDVLGQLVVNVAAPGSQRPEPGDDVARVRVNDVVNIPILANDTDPDGDQLTVTAFALDPVDQPGTLWLDGRVLRYRAGAVPGRVTATYTVDDDPLNPGLSAASAFVEITVVDGDPSKNLPPTPPPLEARVFAGSSVAIVLPTVGVDPDGDSVRVVAIGPGPPPASSPPQLGVPVPSTDGVVYRANEGAQGQDIFSYEVEDTFGARAIGFIRVVVVSAPNHPAVLVPDSVTARPGRELQVPVLSNDSDADGDALVLESVEGPPELRAVVNDSRVQLSLPFEEGRWQLVYTASDGRSPSRTQVVTVVSSATAPLLPAVARDDPDPNAAPLDVVVSPDGTSVVTVPVIDNDDDPDGSRDELVVTVLADQGVQATVSPERTVDVVLGERPASFVYSVTDFDGNESFAVVRVPRAPSAASNRPPELRGDFVQAVVVEGQPGAIELANYVTDPDGDPVQLAGDVPSSAQGNVNVSEGNFASFEFTALPFEGSSATIFVPVTDRPGEPDATVILPFTVTVEKPNQPPVVDTYSVEVEQLGPATTFDLVAVGAANDPDGDPLSFTIVGPQNDSDRAQGFAPSISPSGQVSITADDSAAEGSSATFRYTVTDGQPDREPVTGAFAVRVVASTRPLVQLNPISRVDLKQGEADRVEPLVGVANPFPSIPLEITEAAVVNGRGTVTFDASSVTYTPPADFFGVAEVRYTVIDGTGSPSRQARGSISYTVIGRPLAPGQPRVTEVASRTATIEWIPADPQGSPITDYLVSWAGGQARTGGATNLTVNTLTNNTPYTFTVAAINAVGTGPPSAGSQTVIPDEVPLQMAPPRVVAFGDQTLTVEWDEGAADGSPVFQYHVTLSGGETRIFGARTRSVVWPGLENGRQYTFTVVAENNAGRSEVSGLSNALSPAREPDVPGGTTATSSSNRLVSQVTVSWERPASNGRDIDGYEVRSSLGGLYTSTGLSLTVGVPAGTPVTFAVRARNVVGFSAWSTESAPATGAMKPDTPPPPAVAAGNGLITVTPAAPGFDGGSPITRFEMSVNGGAFGAFSPTIGGLTNGGSYSVAIIACNAASFCSDPSGPSAVVIPFGPPIAGSITRSGPLPGSNIFVISWDTRGSSNGREIVQRTVAVTPTDIVRGPWVYLSNAGVTNINPGTEFTGQWNTTYTVTLTVFDSGGLSATSRVVVPIGPQP